MLRIGLLTFLQCVAGLVISTLCRGFLKLGSPAESELDSP